MTEAGTLTLHVDHEEEEEARPLDSIDGSSSFLPLRSRIPCGDTCSGAFVIRIAMLAVLLVALRATVLSASHWHLPLRFQPVEVIREFQARPKAGTWVEFTARRSCYNHPCQGKNGKTVAAGTVVELVSDAAECTTSKGLQFVRGQTSHGWVTLTWTNNENYYKEHEELVGPPAGAWVELTKGRTCYNDPCQGSNGKALAAGTVVELVSDAVECTTTEGHRFVRGQTFDGWVTLTWTHNQKYYKPVTNLDNRTQVAACQQAKSLWCWAATTANVMAFFDDSSSSSTCFRRQCDLVSKINGADCCAKSQSSSHCNHEGNSYDITHLLNDKVGQAYVCLGGCSGSPLGSIRQTDLDKILSKGKPVIYEVEWLASCSRHYMVLVGSDEHGMYYVHDPNRKNRGHWYKLTYSQLVRNDVLSPSRVGSWMRTIFINDPDLRDITIDERVPQCGQ